MWQARSPGLCLWACVEGACSRMARLLLLPPPLLTGRPALSHHKALARISSAHRLPTKLFNTEGTSEVIYTWASHTSVCTHLTWDVCYHVGSDSAGLGGA